MKSLMFCSFNAWCWFSCWLRCKLGDFGMYGLDGGQLGLIVLCGEEVEEVTLLGFGLNACGELIFNWLSPVAGEGMFR